MIIMKSKTSLDLQGPFMHGVPKTLKAEVLGLALENSHNLVWSRHSELSVQVLWKVPQTKVQSNYVQTENFQTNY